MKLSILTPSLPSRHESLNRLRAHLDSQIGNLPVEHLIFIDNKRRSIGQKRQSLLDIARGDYIAFCDDDDGVSDDYVWRILDAIKERPDVITFKQHASWNGQVSEVVFKMEHQDSQFIPGGTTLRAPWHVCAWRRDIARGAYFPDSQWGEDQVWALQARRHARTSVHIDHVLHFYAHDDRKSEALTPPIR